MEIYHKIAGVIIRNKKLLMVRKYNEPHFIMPGGRVEEKESKDETLKRELKEELNVNLKSMKFFATKEAVHFQNKDKLVRMEMYFAEIEGEPKATSEIDEIKWIDSNYKKQGIKLASINEDFTIPELKRNLD